MITKAIIAAAGRGTRFLPVVKAYPKELIPVLDKPQLQYLVEELIGAGVTQICIVHRPHDNSIQEYFTPDPELEKYLETNNKTQYLESLKAIWSKATFTFIPQDSSLPYGNASPLLSAVSFIGSDNFFYLFGDDLTIEEKPGSFLQSMLDTFDQKQADAVLATQAVPWEEISRYGSILFDQADPTRILNVFEKVPREQAPSNITQLGRFLYNSKIIDVLKNTPIKNNELWLADGNAILAQTHRVYAQNTPTPDTWMTTGDPLRWLKVNLVLGLKHPELKTGLIDFLRQLPLSKDNG